MDHAAENVKFLTGKCTEDNASNSSSENLSGSIWGMVAPVMDGQPIYSSVYLLLIYGLINISLYVHLSSRTNLGLFLHWGSCSWPPWPRDLHGLR